jgi:predicted ATPase
MKCFLKRVVLKDYKSIAVCDVSLRPLCFLVGRNGSGKSNFVDALRLVSDALNSSLDHALRDRGGINGVRRRSAGHPTHFGIRLEVELLDGRYAYYAFRVGSRPQGGFDVQEEECRAYPSTGSGWSLGTAGAFFAVASGRVTSSSIPTPPAAKDDRLYLVNLSGYDEFRPLYDALSQMGFYNLNPDAIRADQPPDVGRVLKRDGSNLASVLDRMQRSAPQAKEEVEELLSKVVPDIEGVASRTVLSKETIEFRQATKGSAAPWRFLAANMSDGTLRALGVLVALFQGADAEGERIPLVGIEEPEGALHPAAAGVLRDALCAASHHTQVLVTSHSPDLLDDKQIDAECLLAVSNQGGVTEIRPIDEASRSAIRDGLYTAGELLRMDQLSPAPNMASSLRKPLQPKLFERNGE